MYCSTPGRKTPAADKHMARLAQLQNQFSKNSEDILEACRTVMRHASVTTEISVTVDVCILTERASAQSISATRLWLVPHGFNMKTCGFTVQSDKVDASLPALQENWAEVKRSILQSETAVITAVAQQIQGAQHVITESVGASLAVTTSQNNHTHMMLGQILQVLQSGFAAADAPANGQMHYQGNETLQMPVVSFMHDTSRPQWNHFAAPPEKVGLETSSTHASPIPTALQWANMCKDTHMGDEGEHSVDFMMAMTDQEEQAYRMLSSVGNLCGESVFDTVVQENPYHLLTEKMAPTPTCRHQTLTVSLPVQWMPTTSQISNWLQKSALNSQTRTFRLQSAFKKSALNCRYLVNP